MADPAIDPVLLENLINSIQSLNASVVRLGSSTGGAGGDINNLGGASRNTSRSLTALNAAFSGLAGVLSSITGFVGAAGGAFVNLSLTAVDGKASLSEFTNQLDVVANAVPVFGGVLGLATSSLKGLITYQQNNLAAYQQLTEAGANFGGSLTKIRQAALDSYMDLSSFSNLMKSNTGVMMKLGGTVNGGAEAFSKLSNTLIKGKAGDYLLSLGYTTDQLNSGLANYLELTGYRSSREERDVNRLAASSAQYLEQLDGLSRITGQSREEQQRLLAEQSKNAAWEAKMAEMTPEQRDKALAGMANALAIGGKGAVDAFQSRLLGIAPDKAGAMFIATAGNAASVIDKSADMVNDGTKRVKDMSVTLRDGMRAAQQDFAKYGKEGLYAIIRNGGDAASALQAIGITANKAANMSDEEIRLALERKAIEASEAAQMAEANKAVQSLGQAINGFLAPIIISLTGPLTELAKKFRDFVSDDDLKNLGTQISGFVTEAMVWIKEYLPVIKEGLISFGNMVKEFVQNLFTDAGRTKIANDISYYFQLLMIEVKKAVMPKILYNEEDAKRDREALKEKKRLADSAATASQEGNTSAIDAATERLRKLRISEDRDSADTKKIAAMTAAGAVVGSILPGIGTALGAAAGFLGAKAGVWMRDTFSNDTGNREKSGEVKRSTGSLGSVGKLFEDFGKGTKVELHGNEAVITPDQMSRLMTDAMKTGQNNNLDNHLETLNKQTADLVKTMKEVSETMRRNLDATRSLTGNLFPN